MFYCLCERWPAGMIHHAPFDRSSTFPFRRARARTGSRTRDRDLLKKQPCEIKQNRRTLAINISAIILRGTMDQFDGLVTKTSAQILILCLLMAFKCFWTMFTGLQRSSTDFKWTWNLLWWLFTRSHTYERKSIVLINIVVKLLCLLTVTLQSIKSRSC